MSGQMGNTDITPPTVVADGDRRGMMWRFLHSLRGRLIALVLLGAVPGLGAILYTAETQRQTARTGTEESTLRLARLAADAQQDLIAETRQLLSVLTQLPAVRADRARECHTLFARLLKRDPRYLNVGAIRPDGEVYCSALPTKGRVNAGDRSYFQRALQTRDFAIGDYQIGIITGQASINLAQPILDSTGQVQSVVFAALNLGWINRLAGQLQLPPGSTLTLVDRDGTILVHHPDGAEKWVGRPMPETGLLSQMQARDEGVATLAGPDGRARLYAFSTLYDAHASASAYLYTGIPLEVAYAEADRIQYRHLLTFALAVLLMLGAAWAGGDVFVLRQVNALLGAVQRLRAGDLGARTGLSAGVDEIGQLAQAFDQMAAALEQRTGENKEKERRIVRLNRVYAMLSRINSAIIRLRVRTELLQETCRIAVEAGRFRLAWIGLTDPQSGELVPFCHAGDEAGYREQVRLSLKAGAEEEPIAARLRAGRTAVCNDIAHETWPAAWRAQAAAHGYRGGALLPLRVAGETIGALTLYADEPALFDAEEVKLLEELAADISLGLEYIEKDNELHQLSYYDPLTDLPNRLLFSDRLHQALSRAQYRGRHVAVLMLYVERLKEINSLHGHHTGDALLRDVARRLKALLRPGDTAARFGSATFGILLADVAETPDVVTVAGRMVHSLQAPVTLNGEELFVTVRLGIAVSPRDGDETEALIRHAEAAVHLPPDEAGSAFHFYRAEIDQQAAERLELEKALRHALERRELRLHYQPVVDIQTLEVVGAEALMRWQHPALGAVPPARFIPLAEETGLIVPLGEWALETALAQSRRWQARGLPITVAVNLSVKQLQQADFAERLAGLLKAAGPVRLALEITESLLMKAPERYVALLNTLRTQDVSIYIDDFGTGYSSLAYLKRLPVDVLKIDISFVRDIARDPEDAAIVKAIVALAHSLGMKAIAEGVETAEQFSALRALSVDAAQGFLFSPAVPAEAFEALGRRPFPPPA